MASDYFAHLLPTKVDPVENAAVPTLSDTVDLPIPTRGLYVGSTGDVKVTLVNGDVVTYTSMAAGVTHAKRIKRIWLNGTTATGLIAEW
jgi:hypothetical protein